MSHGVAEWLERLGLGRYAKTFADNEIDLRSLPHLTEDDLKEIGIALGARRTLLAAAAELGQGIDPSAAGEAEQPSARGEAERRQLTVMFVDLVGSTELSAKLDPEDLRDVTRRYQNAVAGEVARYEGHVAKFMGDGVLVYFGYPSAHEDEAERAVRAALDIVAAVQRETAAQQRLQVRIGIATGQVVVGDLVGEGTAQETAVTGETPNLAARLQELAEPGSVVIAKETHDLLGGLFDLEQLTARPLKGFSKPVPSWRVLGERSVDSRFEAARGQGIGRLVGRAEELSLLEERWSRARGGEGQVVLLTGEAGIGKSRLTRALMERLAAEPHTRLRYQCSPHHVNSTLYPFIVQLERAAGISESDGADAKWAKLEKLLRQGTDDLDDDLPIIASLLGLPAREGNQEAEPDPQRKKQRTLEALLDQLAGLAGRRPVLVVFEDAHWADPTSRELLEQMVGRVQEACVLAVITGRPEFNPPWPGHSDVTMLTLNHLGRRQGAEIVTELTGGKPLPANVLEQIVARTDGVPLFVEELTKTILESGLLEDAGDRYLLKGDLGQVAIPNTLKDSLMARLDRLAPVKEVAQIGAAIGREFSQRLLAEVTSLTEGELTDALDQLVDSELLVRRGSPPDATYTFRHALVQDTAYESLLRTKRRNIHLRIAETLETGYPERTASEPEVLAHHFREGGSAERAIPYLQRAGQRAAESSADAEAYQHLRTALYLLETCPDDEQRQRRELALRTVLGPVLMNIYGSGSNEVRDSYSRARELCDRLGTPSERFPVLWGLWLHYNIGGKSKAALSLAHEAIDLAESLADEDFVIQAHHAAWTTQMVIGDFNAVCEHADKALELYDEVRHRHHAYMYGGHDPGVCASVQGAVAIWFVGYPEQAEKRSEQAMDLASRVGHSFSTAQVLATVAQLHLIGRDPENAIQYVDQLIAHCDEHGLGLWRANGEILRSWALSEMADAAEVLNGFREGIRRRQDAGSHFRLPLQYAAMARALARAGEMAEAQETIRLAADLMERTGERTWEALIHWIRGEIVASAPGADPSDADDCYRQAGEIARRQGARSIELRAASCRARLLLRQGKKKQARELLAPIHDCFTEGFDTADLKDAKELLDAAR